MERPRLRTADKTEPPYHLNRFPSDFSFKLGREIIYLLATKGRASLEGEKFERIFAIAINAEWKPSNIGLDDIAKGNTAWGAKTVKSSLKDFKTLKTVRLISGRNSTIYSFNRTLSVKSDPNQIGRDVLAIWNARVESVRERFRNVRTVVLVKSDDLLRLAIFEFDTILYDHELYDFSRNKGGNLEGHTKDGVHKFTWQPHGSQFIIKEEVPDNRLIVHLKQPDLVDKDLTLDSVGFDSSWVTVIENTN